MSTHVFGYAASVLLFATLAVQIRKQWKRGTTKGVSRWLFIGQLLASVGFTIHSAIIGSTLFVVVNTLLAASAVVGIVLWFVQHRRERRHPHSDRSGSAPGDTRHDARNDSDPSVQGGLTTEVRA